MVPVWEVLHALATTMSTQLIHHLTRPSHVVFTCQAFVDEGADIVFVDALQSKEEMQRFCKVAPGVAHMANMLEGGGKTPICSLPELEDMGYKIVAYPLSMLGVSVRAEVTFPVCPWFAKF